MKNSYSDIIRINLFDLVFFVLGATISWFAYVSFMPILVASLFGGGAYSLLSLPKIGGFYERKIFSRVFTVGFIMSGVAAVYANYLHDPNQLYGDAAGFFDMASMQAKGLTLSELQGLHDGGLAIVIWQKVYDFFEALGFHRERYIGILFNVTVVASTSVIALKMARQIYGNDSYRFQRLTLLSAACGLFWLFAGIHLRDSTVMLIITVLAYIWLYFLSRPDIGWRLFLLIAGSLFAEISFVFLRWEFILVPIAMNIAGATAMMIGHQQGGRKRTIITCLLVLFCIVNIARVQWYYGTTILNPLLHSSEKYARIPAAQPAAELAAQKTSTSLGMILIVNQPIYIRLFLGSIYLLVFPIPFWVGFQSQSVYTLFKTFNVIYFYFLIPLLCMSLRLLWKEKKLCTPSVLFLLFLFLGFTVTIAGTSLETRHFGVFLIPIFLFALLPDLRIPALRENYKKLLMTMLSCVALVHIAWVFLKFA